MFTGLQRISRKVKAGKAKQPPTPPSSSSPRSQSPAPSLHRTKPRDTAEVSRPKSGQSLGENRAPPPPAALDSEPSDDEDEIPVKTKKRTRPAAPRESTPEAEDQEPGPAPVKKRFRQAESIVYDAEIIKEFELVVKCKTQDQRIQNGVEGHYQDGRNLARWVGTDVDYDVVLPRGLARDGQYSQDDPENDDPVWDQYHKVKYYYMGIKAIFPRLMENAEYLRTRPDLVGKLAKWMSSVAGKARGDDLNRIKEKILSHTGVVDTKGLAEKTSRGFRHRETGRLLCPITMLDRFDENPDDFCRSVHDMHEPRPKVTGRAWPVMMYDMKQYVPGDQQSGFLKSDILLKCALNVFAGPSAARNLNPRIKVKGKPPVIKRMCFDTFNIFSIVYIASLARFALSAQPEWLDRDGDFYCMEFAESVLTCAVRDKEWQEEITSWYTERVLDLGHGKDKETRDEEVTAFDQMMAQIEAKKKKKKKEVAAAAATTHQAEVAAAAQRAEDTAREAADSGLSDSEK